MFSGRVDVSSSAQRVDQAARIWAEAMAARDQDSDPGPITLARGKIAEIVEQTPGALLLTAVDTNDNALGFAAAAPITPTRAELHYLGVDPSAWGRNVGKRLLHELKLVLHAHGYRHGELWVYEDNPAAVALYTGCGWRLLGKTQAHPTSGRIEQRYFQDLT